MDHPIVQTADKRREQRIGPGLHQVAVDSVEVFFVDFGEESAIARRRYVGTLHRGDVCSGSRRVGANAYFAVRAATNPLDKDLIRPSDPNSLDPTHLTRWLQLLGAAPLKGPIPRVTRPVAVGEHLLGRANEVIVLGSEGALLRLNTGSAYLWSRRSRVSTLDGGPWPLAPHTWWLLREESRIEVIPWDEAPCGADLAEVFDRYTALMVDLLVQDGRTRDGVELRRLGRLDTEDRTLMSRSCTSLASVLQSAAEPIQARDPLEAAAARVGTDLGMTIKPGSSGSDRRSGVRLRTMARANHFRVRRVALRGNWWMHESSPMLAVWKDESGQSQPVSLLPGGSSRIRGSRFKLWHPSDGIEKVVDQDVAARIAPFAYVFYPPAPERPSSLLSLALHAARGGSRDVWPLLLLGIVAGGLSAMTPVLTGKVYDVAIPDASRTQLTYIVALLLSIAAASLLMQFVRAVAILRLETRIDDSLQSAVWDHLLRLPAVFFRRFTAGDLATRAGAVAQMRYLLSSAATGVMLTGIFGAWYLGLMFYYDARMAAWLSAALVGLSVVSLLLARIQMRHQRRATVIQSRMSGLVLQLITGISKLRVAGAEIRAFSRWAEAFADQRRWYVRGRRANNLLVALQSTGPLLLLALAYGLLFRMSEPALSTGELLAFQTALVALIASVGSLTQIFAAASSAIPLFEQMLPILECEPEQTAARADPGELTGDVDIRHVTFGYDADAPPVLDDVSLHVPAGSFVALVGPSGSGKSSILRLLLGFESPSSGSIYFDGQDIAGLDPLALRRQFGVVLQDAGIIAGDVFTNIAGATDATVDDAWEAARLAGLADDIRAMPMGMHTVIDQNGTTISGGQRQRMMIARAIVSRPRILLMDEATSALDNLTQEQVSRSLAKLNVTRIVVAHRLTTIMDADVIYVLDGGRIVEQGPYAALMKEKGLFYRLARRQMLEVKG